MIERPLEPDRATFEDWLRRLTDFALREIAELQRRPAVGSVGPEGWSVARSLDVEIPEAPHPGGPDELATILAGASQASFTTNGPGYLAYVPGGGLPSSALADLIGGLINRYTGVAAAAPALCRLEATVLQWLAAQFGLPSAASGLLTSGGSMANFSAIVTARHERLGDHGDWSRAIVYTSSQVHHSVAKSVMLAGIPAANVRAVDTDERLRLRTDAFVRAVELDRAAGLQPFLLVSSAGTTNTGAIDPLPELGRSCRDLGLWHHVDAAYGGAFVLCDEGRARLRGIEAADSITFDPHKGLFLPYGTGCLLVADGEALHRAHRASADYLQDAESLHDPGTSPNPSDYGPELSRPYRGLRLWLPLQLHGAAAFRAALAEKLRLASELYEALQRLVDRGVEIELTDPPQLSVVAFRLRRAPAEPLQSWNSRNAAFLAEINARRRVYLSSTALPVPDGLAFTLRACVLSFRTHAEHIERAVEDIEAALVA